MEAGVTGETVSNGRASRPGARDRVPERAAAAATAHLIQDTTARHR